MVTQVTRVCQMPHLRDGGRAAGKQREGAWEDARCCQHLLFSYLGLFVYGLLRRGAPQGGPWAFVTGIVGFRDIFLNSLSTL